MIDPVSGDDATSCDQAQGGGTWAPLDPRDAGGVFTQNPGGCEHTLADKSIAIQKGVSVVGGGQPVPDRVLEYTLAIQISDFFAFDGVLVTDDFSDGQHFDATFAPTLTVAGNSLQPAAGGLRRRQLRCHLQLHRRPGPECTVHQSGAPTTARRR